MSILGLRSFLSISSPSEVLEDETQMTLKIIQGLIGKKDPLTTQTKDVARQGQLSAASSAVTQQIQSEAAITTVRSTKGAAFLKIREYKEAKQVAEEVAESIRTEPDESQDAHNKLSSTAARSHFSS